MSTRIREFRTIKGAEFYLQGNMILDPTQITLTRSTNTYKIPSASDIPARKMREFLESHKEKFNESQQNALLKVS